MTTPIDISDNQDDPDDDGSLLEKREEDNTPPSSVDSSVTPKEDPKFSFVDVLGDDAGIARLVKKIRKKIDKEGWEQVEFTDREDKPVFDFNFPPFYAGENDFLKNFAHPYFDGDSAYLALDIHNDLNRPVTLPPVIDMAAQILTGRWRERTHQGIAFSRPRTSSHSPEVQDGQHRLLSIYLASIVDPKVKVRMLTAFNTDPENSDKIDGNTVRGTKDRLVMLLKQDGHAFKNDSYKGIKDKDIISAVKAMPGHSGITEDRALAFAKEHLSTIVEFLLVLQSTRSIRYKASWAGPIIKAGILFGREAVLPIAQRFQRNQWTYFEESNRMDPFQSFHERMVRDANNGPSQKIRGDGIKAMAMYATRKSLLKESVSSKRGSRYMAEFIRFSEDEVQDYLQHGDKSKILKARAKARHLRNSASG